MAAGLAQEELQRVGRRLPGDLERLAARARLPARRVVSPSSSTSLTTSICARLELAVDGVGLERVEARAARARRSARTAGACRVPRPRRPAAAGRRSAAGCPSPSSRTDPSSRTRARPNHFSLSWANARNQTLCRVDKKRRRSSRPVASRRSSVPAGAPRRPIRRHRARRRETTPRARRTCATHAYRSPSLVSQFGIDDVPDRRLAAGIHRVVPSASRKTWKCGQFAGRKVRIFRARRALNGRVRRVRLALAPSTERE